MTRPQDIVDAPWRTLSSAQLKPADAVPTMLGEDERKLYYWLASTYASDAGSIVDLGAYVGGSTAYLAAGQAVRNGTERIHAYDRFEIHNEDRKARLIEQGVPPFEGSDIMPAIETMLSPWKSRITLHPGDLRSKYWNGGPIEVLIVDAAKHADTGDHIARTFFPHLIPGRSLVVHQDFLNSRQPWIAAQMSMLSGYFQPLALCGTECMVFLNTVPIPATVLEQAKIETMTNTAYLRALRDISDQLSPMVGERPMRRLRKTAKTYPGIRVAHKLARAMRRDTG